MVNQLSTTARFTRNRDSPIKVPSPSGVRIANVGYHTRDFRFDPCVRRDAVAVAAIRFEMLRREEQAAHHHEGIRDRRPKCVRVGAGFDGP